MKESKSIYVSVLLASLSLILSSCSKYKEPAPFFDGLLLEYDEGSGLRLIYEVQDSDNDGFKITETEKRAPLSDDVEELFVDAYGRVYKSTFEPYKGRFSPIWIPVKKIEIGDTFDSRSVVVRKDQWKKWQVLVIKDTLTQSESYFDLNTGFWVGSFAKTPVGAGEIVLVKTNADIPVEVMNE